MKGGVWPNLRLSVIALAVASMFAAALSPPALADPPPQADRVAPPHSSSHPRNRASRSQHTPKVDAPASDTIMRTAVPPDLDERRRDGHMTPEERRLLRQHIEDAVRELYKR
ncbi:hypothetical protein GCM10027093_67280 [Paraburkholderia jirisanensis]